MTNNDNDDDDNNDSNNNNYRDLTKDLKETLEAMEREGKEEG